MYETPKTELLSMRQIFRLEKLLISSYEKRELLVCRTFSTREKLLVFRNLVNFHENENLLKPSF